MTQEPVFVDPSGRRRRLVRMTGIAGAVVAIAGLIFVGVGLSAESNVPMISARLSSPSPSRGRH